MPRFIVTGCYTQAAMKGMIASPSDREAASAALVKAAGGTQEAYYATTGATDFMLIVTVDDVSKLLAGLMVAGASGATSNLQTQRAFSSAELTEIQKEAGKIASAYTPPG
ncbi:GYD domain-containing protein [Tropicimonas aquimaris]|uniref:GYD domain-containing protein n=1 Tax=Tropicimonas aquimaris TaxID=914152 RepID=A0ABW3INN6_9RHOB